MESTIAKFRLQAAHAAIPRIEAQFSMIIKTVAFSVVACFLISCMHIATAIEISVPQQAFGEVSMHPNDKERGVVFHVAVEKSSYKFVDDIRNQLQSAGLKKCTKSAISEWKPMPDSSEPDATWLIEIYSDDHQNKFAVLRVEQHAHPADEKIDQKFSIFFQDVNSQMRNSAVIDEFCETLKPA